jgi:hypothetical protein
MGGNMAELSSEELGVLAKTIADKVIKELHASTRGVPHGPPSGGSGYNCTGAEFSCTGTYNCEAPHSCSGTYNSPKLARDDRSTEKASCSGTYNCNASSFACHTSAFACQTWFKCPNSFTG